MTTSNFRIHLVLYILFIGSPFINSLQFSYNGSSSEDLIYIQKPNTGDSSIDGNGMIDLTRSTAADFYNQSCGWISYKEPIPLKNPKTGQQVAFTTHFSFKINAYFVGNHSSGDGLAFFMSPYPHTLPVNCTSFGGRLGLFTNASSMIFSENQVVAVEFDTYKNYYDPDAHHVGIDVNTINSTVYQTLDEDLMKNGTLANAWISYDTQTLSVYLSYHNNTARPIQPILSYPINLVTVLPDEVVIGFTAATGSAFELHQIFSWDFDSSLDIEMNNGSSPAPSPAPYPEQKKTKLRFILLLGASGIIGLVVVLVAVVWFLVWMKNMPVENEEVVGDSDQTNNFFGKKSKRYTYESLVIATSNFSDENKLGEGGSGPVFKGVLKDSKCDVAVKRVCNRTSEEALKEYKSEIKILSRSSHRNIIKLKGWCEEKSELLLVYKFMPNGSLDSQLYSKDRLLTWPERYNIACGLASGLNYLHEECERYILHRDIKPGNVLLDSKLEAKLSDFGLSRLVDHNRTSKTNTRLIGTSGYFAPELFNGERVRKKSDIYSFGVVLLEMACGRRPFSENLVKFVRDLYGRGDILQAADKRLNGEYDKQEMKRMLIVGLWCAQQSYDKRPKISQVISVLKHDSELPDLPSSTSPIDPSPIDHQLLIQKALAWSPNEGPSSLDHHPFELE